MGRGGRKMGLSGLGERSILAFFLPKANFFKPALPKPHHYKLPSARTHWSTSKDVPLSLEKTLKTAFTASPSGDRTCVT